MMQKRRSALVAAHLIAVAHLHGRLLALHTMDSFTQCTFLVVMQTSHISGEPVEDNL